MAAEEDSKRDDAVEIELPAPAGWFKKVIPKKSGTPQRNDIVFISPTGDEIKTKRQLEQYLKSHPGGPSASEFDWATGDTPRRSARLSEKSKAVETPAIQSPTKKQKRSNTKRGASEKSNAKAEDEAAVQKDAAGDENKENADSVMTDSKRIEEGESVSTQALPENTDVENAEKKVATETEPPNDAKPDNANSKVKESADAKIEESNKTPEVQNPESETQNNESFLCHAEKEKEAPVETTEDAIASHTEKEKEKETPVETTEDAIASHTEKEKETPVLIVASPDQDNSKEKREENPSKKDAALQEPAATSSS